MISGAASLMVAVRVVTARRRTSSCGAAMTLPGHDCEERSEFARRPTNLPAVWSRPGGARSLPRGASMVEPTDDDLEAPDLTVPHGLEIRRSRVRLPTPPLSLGAVPFHDRSRVHAPATEHHRLDHRSPEREVVGRWVGFRMQPVREHHDDQLSDGIDEDTTWLTVGVSARGGRAGSSRAAGRSGRLLPQARRVMARDWFVSRCSGPPAHVAGC